MEVAHPLRAERERCEFFSKMMCAAEVFWEINVELFYLDHLLCDLSGLVNIQNNLGIPHHRIKCPSFTQTERGGKKRQGRDFNLLC